MAQRAAPHWSPGLDLRDVGHVSSPCASGLLLPVVEVWSKNVTFGVGTVGLRSVSGLGMLKCRAAPRWRGGHVVWVEHTCSQASSWNLNVTPGSSNRVVEESMMYLYLKAHRYSLPISHVLCFYYSC